MQASFPSFLQVIADEWQSRSRDLAEWAFARLVNRKDVWGQYTVPTAQEKFQARRSYKALTLPQKSKRGQDMVTLEKLHRHFSCQRRNHIIGLHACSAESTSRWMAIDLDLHDRDAVEAEDTARRNLAAAVGWWDALRELGFDPLLLDSNGHGGIHLWTLFEEPVPTETVYEFLRVFVSDWKERNLDAVPEIFPRSPELSGDKLGAWLRLPGLHHTYDHITKVWSGEPWLDDPWLSGADAINVLLETRPGPPPPKVLTNQVTVAEKEKKSSKPKPRVEVVPHSTQENRPVVCIDLDGVLAHYDGWRGKGKIGEPIEGAIEFTRSLAQDHFLLIYTVRVQSEQDVPAIREWLEQNQIAYHDIYIGPGKPRAHAFVDDRAVVCEPQKQGLRSFLAAEERIRLLSKVD